jgi:Chromo (CHRromatin Organisation MOdifier) domain/Integrase p58, C-terminal domain
MPEPFEHSEHPTVKARMTKLAQWRKDVIVAHEYARERMKNRITENYKPFDKGQLLWLEGRNLKLGYNKKIMMKREGPFPIIERLGPINYRLKLPPGWKNHNVFNVNLLTLYTETAVHGTNFPHPPPDVINEKEEWEVERIIKHQGKKKLQYQVKWTGYEDITWEPESNLRNAQEALTEY